MSVGLGVLDAVLTAVAAGATVTAVVIAKRTLRASQEAEVQMRATAQQLATISAPIGETAETLSRLQRAVHCEAGVARAARLLVLAEAALAAIDTLQDAWDELLAGPSGLATADRKARRPYQQAHLHFQSALRSVAPDDNEQQFKAAWDLARSPSPMTSRPDAVRPIFEKLLHARQDGLQAAEDTLQAVLSEMDDAAPE